MLKEFKAFVLRGNVVDLAVGVVIGAAFGAIVTSLVRDVLTPLLGLLNVPDFSERSIGVGKDAINYGLFINAIVSFLLIAAAVFFFVVKPVNRLMIGGKAKEEPKVKECPHCLSSIPAAAKVCAHCGRAATASRSRK
ncbi:MAG TPA: large conductance mechanosensitive channel protein MscL [Actinomycetota bacterium]|jgi:large conductance mechanosensitive channel|nr:large conductance mechanosensitive channel protein MscL [Actinomycetota bacterium]